MGCMKKFKKKIKTFVKRLEHTCANLTLHGPSFLVRKDVHFIFRLIYFVIYIHVWAAVIFTIRKYYIHFGENSIRFTIKTDYLHWNTTFPSITACEVRNINHIWSITKDLYEDKQGDIDRFIAEIAFFQGTCYSCKSTCQNSSTCNKDFKELVTLYRAPCESLFKYCFWNGKMIDCCKYFQPLLTEYGVCYSINNKHTVQEVPHFVTSRVSVKNMIETLEIIMMKDYEVYVHSPEDIPFYNIEYNRRIRILYGSTATMVFSILDIENEPEVSLTTPEIRQCRFTNELPPNFEPYTIYSYSVCITQCRIAKQYELCNCTHHLSPPAAIRNYDMQYTDQYCDLDGLKCLTDNYDSLRKLKVLDTNDTGLECDCLPSCTEPDYNIVATKLVGPQDDSTMSTAKFTLSNKPYERINRQVSRTALDVVVAMGNCVSLYLGGSLLSIVEIVYYIFFKRWKINKK